IFQFHYPGFLQSGAAGRRTLERGFAFAPALAGVVREVRHGNATRAELAVYGWMECDRQEDTPAAKLDHAIIVQHEVAVIADAKYGLAPGFCFVGRVAQIRMTVADRVFADVEKGNAAVLETKQGDAHDVHVAFAGHDRDVRGGPGP